MRRPRMGRGGMTLVELLVALTVFGIVITVTLGFVSQQNTAFHTAIERLGALRNVRYAVDALVQDLETLGTNVPTGQPSLIYGDADVVVFSADYAANVADPFAVFHDPDAPAGQVQAPTGPFTIPTTAHTAADTAYTVGPGIPSPAEMLSFFFLPDTLTARGDDFLFVRQVNGGPPEVLARHILRVAGGPFLAYERVTVDGSGNPVLEVVADSLLPIHHTARVHLSPADTGQSAWADSVRAVRITLRGTNGLVGADERTVEATRLIALPNAGLTTLNTCGSAPIFGEALGASVVTLAGGEKVVELQWDPAVDEVGGEADVVRYVIWRRETGQLDWGEPYMALPAGAPDYAYTDATIESGTSYQFAVAAQDCTPSLSSLSASASVVVP
jgi:prepilin-type N-terminal cleavage/methylation domain-containing protein